MKKAKFIPAMLLLVLCVGIMAVGLYAIAPTYNSISGTIVVNAASAQVMLEGYIEGQEEPVWGPYTTRTGAPEAWELPEEAITYNLNNYSNFGEIEDKVFVIKVTNLSPKEIGAYFYNGDELIWEDDPEDDRDNYVTEDFIKVKDELKYDINETPEDKTDDIVFANMFLSSYTHMFPAGSTMTDADGEEYATDTADMEIRIRLIDIVKIPMSDSFTLHLNIEDYVPNVEILEDGEVFVYALQQHDMLLDTMVYGSAGNVSTTGLVKLSSNITKIPDSAFSAIYGEVMQDANQMCQYVVVPSSVTEIGSYAFWGTNIKGISLGKSITALPDGVFNMCNNLVSVDFNERIRYVSCELKEVLEMAYFDSNNVNHTFMGCTNINFNVHKNNPYFSSHQGNLYNKEKTQLICAGGTINSVYIPEGVTRIYPWAFAFSRSKSVFIPEGVEKIEAYTFGGSYLESIILPTTIKEIQMGAFTVTPIKTINLPVGLEIIEDVAFMGCSQLERVVLPSNLKHISINAFTECDSLITTSYNNAEYISAVENPYFMLYKATSEDITSCNVAEGTEYIHNDAFLNCENLQELTVPSSIIDVGNIINPYIDLLSYNGGKYLTNSQGDPIVLVGADENIDNLEIASTTRVIHSMALSNQTALSYVSLPDGLKSIGAGAFNYCSALKQEIELPESLQYLRVGAFMHSGITGAFIPSSVYLISALAFAGCDDLDLINIEDGVKSVGSYAFMACSSLQTVQLPETITTLGPGAFANSGVREVTIVGNVASIGFSTFRNCENLMVVNLAEGIEKIGAFAFENCINLENIGLPESLVRIEPKAFDGCDKLSDIQSGVIIFK